MASLSTDSSGLDKTHSNPHPTSLNSDSASPLASTSTAAASLSSSIQSLSVHSDHQEQNSNQNHNRTTSTSPSLSPSCPIDKSFQDHHNRQFIDLVNGKLKDDRLKFPIMPSHQRNIIQSSAKAFNLEYNLDPQSKTISIIKTSNSRVPTHLQLSSSSSSNPPISIVSNPTSPTESSLSQTDRSITPSSSTPTTPSGNNMTFRIMRRGDKSNNNSIRSISGSSSSSNSINNSNVNSTTTSRSTSRNSTEESEKEINLDGGDDENLNGGEASTSNSIGGGGAGTSNITGLSRKDRSKMTIEERERAYKEARERIFGKEEEINENLEGIVSPGGSSSTSSQNINGVIENKLKSSSSIVGEQESSTSQSQSISPVNSIILPSKSSSRKEKNPKGKEKEKEQVEAEKEIEVGLERFAETEKRFSSVGKRIGGHYENNSSNGNYPILTNGQNQMGMVHQHHPQGINCLPIHQAPTNGISYVYPGQESSTLPNHQSMTYSNPSSDPIPFQYQQSTPQQFAQGNNNGYYNPEHLDNQGRMNFQMTMGNMRGSAPSFDPSRNMMMMNQDLNGYSGPDLGCNGSYQGQRQNQGQGQNQNQPHQVENEKSYEDQYPPLGSSKSSGSNQSGRSGSNTDPNQNQNQNQNSNQNQTWNLKQNQNQNQMIHSNRSNFQSQGLNQPQNQFPSIQSEGMINQYQPAYRAQFNQQQHYTPQRQQQQQNFSQNPQLFNPNFNPQPYPNIQNQFDPSLNERNSNPNFNLGSSIRNPSSNKVLYDPNSGNVKEPSSDFSNRNLAQQIPGSGFPLSRSSSQTSNSTSRSKSSPVHQVGMGLGGSSTTIGSSGNISLDTPPLRFVGQNVTGLNLTGWKNPLPLPVGSTFNGLRDGLGGAGDDSSEAGRMTPGSSISVSSSSSTSSKSSRRKTSSNNRERTSPKITTLNIVPGSNGLPMKPDWIVERDKQRNEINNENLNISRNSSPSPSVISSISSRSTSNSSSNSSGGGGGKLKHPLPKRVSNLSNSTSDDSESKSQSGSEIERSISPTDSNSSGTASVSNSISNGLSNSFRIDEHSQVDENRNNGSSSLDVES